MLRREMSRAQHHLTGLPSTRLDQLLQAGAVHDMPVRPGALQIVKTEAGNPRASQLLHAAQLYAGIPATLHEYQHRIAGHHKVVSHPVAGGLLRELGLGTEAA